jgi:hypothetical protein
MQGITSRQIKAVVTSDFSFISKLLPLNLMNLPFLNEYKKI